MSNSDIILPDVVNVNTKNELRFKLLSYITPEEWAQIDEICSRPLPKCKWTRGPKLKPALQMRADAQIKKVLREALILGALGFSPMPIAKPHKHAGTYMHLAQYLKDVDNYEGFRLTPEEIEELQGKHTKHPFPYGWPTNTSNVFERIWTNFTRYQIKDKNTGVITDHIIDFEINICLVTGAETGYFLVDIDGDAAHAIWIKMCEEYGYPDPTVTGFSGGGKDRRHIWFRHPPGVEIHSTTAVFGGDGSKIDIKGYHGEGVVSPSTHKSGGVYEFENSPHTTLLAYPPEWVRLEALRVSRITNPTNSISRRQRVVGAEAGCDEAAYDPDDPFGSVARQLRSESGGGFGWENFIAQIGDHKGGRGFHNPIYDASCSYFRRFGPEEPEAVLRFAIDCAIDEAVYDKPRGYLTDSHIRQQIDNGREYVVAQIKDEEVE